MKKKEELPACPVATTVQLIGSKWKLLIMRNLLAHVPGVSMSFRNLWMESARRFLQRACAQWKPMGL